LDGIEAYGAQLQRLLYGRMQIGQIEAFQKTQHLHIGAPTQLAHPRFHQATQCGERLGEFPALERGRLVERIDLVLDQRQVMQWFKDDVFAPITARMTGDGLPAAADHHLIDIATATLTLISNVVLVYFLIVSYYMILLTGFARAVLDLR